MGAKLQESDFVEFMKTNFSGVQVVGSYVSYRAYLDMTCANGHAVRTSFEKLRTHVAGGGTQVPCRACSGLNRRMGYETFLTGLAERTEGRVVCTNPQDFTTAKGRLSFRCDQGHVWDGQADAANTCRKCAAASIYERSYEERLAAYMAMLKHPDEIELTSRFIDQQSPISYLCKKCSHVRTTKAYILKVSGCWACGKDKAISASFRRKKVRLGGKTFHVLGYEDQALRYIVAKGLAKPQEILTDNLPRFQYFNKGKTRYYFPDMHIPSQQRIIEVKSTFTLDLPRLKKKRQAVLDAGYEFSVLLFHKGVRVRLPDNWFTLTQRSLSKAIGLYVGQ